MKNNHKQTLLVNLYAPNTGCFEVLLQNIQTYVTMNDQVIMVGDLNIVLDNKTERKGSHDKNYHPKAHCAIKNLMALLDLVDIWSMNNPLGMCICICICIC